MSAKPTTEMALSSVLKTKMETPYSRLPPLHITVLKIADQPRVLVWEFNDDKPKPKVTKNNAVAVLCDGSTITKVTLLEEVKGRVKEGGSYVIRGYRLRGDSPPYSLMVTRDTIFYRSSVIQVTEELQNQANSLIHPPSPLVDLRSARGDVNLVSIQAEVSELTSIKKLVMGKEEVPFRKISVKQDGLEAVVCLWREAAVLEIGGLGTGIKISHLKPKVTGYGFQLHSTAYTAIEDYNKQDVVITGAYGVAEVEGVPGILELLLDDDRRVTIPESLWTPVERLMEAPPVKVRLVLADNRVVEIDVVL